MLACDVYVQIRRNMFRVRSVTSGVERTIASTVPFTTTRLLVGDFIAADDALRAALSAVGAEWRRRFAPRVLKPRILMHPLEMTDGGLSAVEYRVLHELAHPARKTVVWLGAALSDLQVGEKLDQAK